MRRMGIALGGLSIVYEGGVVAGMTDAQLLERFLRGDGEGAASAFAVLVDRHGPMVHRVCRASLGDEHQAEDAFQAAFLVLVRRARTLWIRDSLGPWLHAVAVRTAAHLRTQDERLRRKERPLADGSDLPDHSERPDAELAWTIHEEVGRLPARFREAVVLCDLEGCSHQEAAGRLGWPIGTVKSRQSRGRERLRDRLARRGVTSGDLAIAAALRPGPVPPAVLQATIRAASACQAGRWAYRSGRSSGPSTRAKTQRRAASLRRCSGSIGATHCSGRSGFARAANGASNAPGRAGRRAPTRNSGGW